MYGNRTKVVKNPVLKHVVKIAHGLPIHPFVFALAMLCNASLRTQSWSIVFTLLYTNGSGTYRILGECLLISSLPGKALRTHVDIARLVLNVQLNWTMLFAPYEFNHLNIS